MVPASSMTSQSLLVALFGLIRVKWFGIWRWKILMVCPPLCFAVLSTMRTEGVSGASLYGYILRLLRRPGVRARCRMATLALDATSAESQSPPLASQQTSGESSRKKPPVLLPCALAFADL